MNDTSKTIPIAVPPPVQKPAAQPEGAAAPQAEEIGGLEGPEPTRFGDWEKAGRCSDF